ncbi:hypothetical protein AB0M39_07480 [Streptomyces sp. NPDC051907]|uniref:hypothetical protein n=1 Tax=Streptomyces sp. NPDC051907 TaxID=3155284 RepID=UPI00342275BA
MEQDHPLVRDVYPDLIAELIALLEAEGERELAIVVWDVRLVARCDCGDDFCQSFHTAVRPKGKPYGEGHRCVPLLPEKGMLVLDVVYGRIMYIEVLDRQPMTAQRSESSTGPTQTPDTGPTGPADATGTPDPPAPTDRATASGA